MTGFPLFWTLIEIKTAANSKYQLAGCQSVTREERVMVRDRSSVYTRQLLCITPYFLINLLVCLVQGVTRVQVVPLVEREDVLEFAEWLCQVPPTDELQKLHEFSSSFHCPDKSKKDLVLFSISFLCLSFISFTSSSIFYFLFLFSMICYYYISLLISIPLCVTAWQNVLFQKVKW